MCGIAKHLEDFHVADQLIFFKVRPVFVIWLYAPPLPLACIGSCYTERRKTKREARKVFVTVREIGGQISR